MKIDKTKVKELFDKGMENTPLKVGVGVGVTGVLLAGGLLSGAVLGLAGFYLALPKKK